MPTRPGYYSEQAAELLACLVRLPIDGGPTGADRDRTIALAQVFTTLELASATWETAKQVNLT